MKTHRYKQLVDALGLSVNQFEKEIDVNTSRISKAISKDYGITTDIILKITSKYPNVSEEWLRNGTGEMFTTKHTIPTINPDTSKKGGVSKWLFDMRNEMYAKVYDKKYPKTAIELEIEMLREELNNMEELARKEKDGDSQ